MLPIENSLAGLVVETWDLLAEGDLPIGGEAVMHIPHCLAVVPGATLEGIETIHSHPVALQQCRRFLNGRFDAHRDIDDLGRRDGRRGARQPGPRRDRVAGRRRALRARDPAGRRSRITRRTSRGSSPSRAARCGRSYPGCAWRTALRVVTDHRPGALHEAIEPLRYHGVNMVSLHSRPILGEPWRYQFSIDIDGHRDEDDRGPRAGRRRAPLRPRGRARRLPDDGPAGRLKPRRALRRWGTGCERRPWDDVLALGSTAQRAAARARRGSARAGGVGRCRFRPISTRGCGRRSSGSASSRSTPTRPRSCAASLAGAHVGVVTGTASGKTLAYALPILQRLVADPARAGAVPRADQGARPGPGADAEGAAA